MPRKPDPLMLVAVPSKGRAGKTRTQTVLPGCTLFVPELEAKAYRAVGCENVVAVPNEVRGITRTRNWILRHTRSPWVVMIDDDVTVHGYLHIGETTTRNVQLDEATWLGEFCKLFEVTEQLAYRIWGVSTDGAPATCYPYWPFRFRSVVTGSCMGILNDGRTLFDESYPVKEDYELNARCIREDGGVVTAQYVYWVNEHYSNAGGCKDYRTQAMERDCISRLCKQYPGIVRHTPTTRDPWHVEIS